MTTFEQVFETQAKQEQLKLLYKGLPMSQAVAFVNAAVLVFFSLGVIADPNVICWGAAFVCVTLLRLFDCYRFMTAQNSPPDSDSRFMLGVASAGLVWGSASWLLFPPDMITNQLLVIFIAAGLTAGALTTLSVSKKAYIVFLSLTLAPLALQLFLLDSSANLAMGGLILLYAGALISAGKMLHDNVRANLALRLKAEVREQQLADNAAKLVQAHKQAESANEAKSVFLANMSHELRTPMNGIIGMTYLVLQSELDKKQKELIATAHSSAQNLLKIINDILDLSKIEAEKLTLEVIPFNISSVLNQVLRDTKTDARKKHINLLLRLDLPDRTELLGDPLRLGQVLTNIVSNAIKFSNEGGQVVIAINAIRSDTHHAVTFAVKDEGIGISKEQLALLFEPFTQADASTTRQYGGTGLGLNIAQQLVQLMGGEIRVDSELGKGSTFSFSLDFRQAAEVQPVSDVPSPDVTTESHLALKNKKILLAEDNPVNQKLAEVLLHSQGCHVTTVENGQEAIAQLQSAQFDCVLMDFQMPVMDGLEATRTIRKMAQFQSLPIIAMTANAMEGDRERALESGMNDYVSKPIDPETLYRTIEQNLPC